jgi:hypothetical protein
MHVDADYMHCVQHISAATSGSDSGCGGINVCGCSQRDAALICATTAWDKWAVGSQTSRRLPCMLRSCMFSTPRPFSLTVNNTHTWRSQLFHHHLYTTTKSSKSLAYDNQVIQIHTLTIPWLEVCKFMLILKGYFFRSYGLDIWLLLKEWSSYDRTWFSGPDKQDIFIFIFIVKRNVLFN